MPSPGFDTYIVDDQDARDVQGVVVHHANGSTTVVPDPSQAGRVFTSGPDGPTWGAPGVPIFIQAAQPSNPPVPSLWIPLDGSGNPLGADHWQVYA